MRNRKATVYVDYQQRAREFSVGDSAYPLAGGSTDESQAGRVVAVYPAIGQVDIEFPWGSGRYPVEEVQRVTDVAALPPTEDHTTIPGGVGTTGFSAGPNKKNALIERVAFAFLRQALYWAGPNRQYKATNQELETGQYRCPKCKPSNGERPFLRPVSYKREEGQSSRLLGCPFCMFLIKRCDIIGDPDFEEHEEDCEPETGTPLVMNQGFDAVRSKTGSESHVVSLTIKGLGYSDKSDPMLIAENWDDVGFRLARNFRRMLTGLMRDTFQRAEYRDRGVLVFFFDLEFEEDIPKLKHSFSRLLGSLKSVSPEFHHLVSGGTSRIPQIDVEVY